jgi:hypothetical protein
VLSGAVVLIPCEETHIAAHSYAQVVSSELSIMSFLWCAYDMKWRLPSSCVANDGNLALIRAVTGRSPCVKR